MTEPLHLRRGTSVTALILALVAIEVFALHFLAAHDVRIDLLGRRSANEFRGWAALIDFLFGVPLAVLSLVLAWGRPTWLAARLSTALCTGWRYTKPLAWMAGIWLVISALRVLRLPDGALIALLALIEVAFLAFILVKLVRLSGEVRSQLDEGYSLVGALLQVLPRGFGNLQLKLALRVAIMEIALLMYSVGGWLIRRPKRGTSFTNNSSEDDTVLVGIGFVIASETIPVHFLAHHYSALVAWILTGLNVYALMWLFGDMAARRRRWTVLTDGWLRATHGLRSEVVIRLADVESVQVGAEVEAQATVGVDPQLLFTLDRPTLVLGMFGREVRASTVAVGCDDPEQLLKELVAVGVTVVAALNSPLTAGA